MENNTHKCFRVRQQGYRQIIQLRTSWLGVISRIFACLFMTVWLTGWSVGCAFLIHGLTTEFSWLMLVFSIPFFVGWFAGVSFLLVSLLGKTRLILDKDHLEYEFLVLVPVKRKRIAHQEVLSIEITRINRFPVIRIESTSEPLTFASGYGLQELEELREYLLDEVPITSGVDKSELADGSVRLQRRTDKPESSRWHLEAGTSQNETRFVNRGGFDFGATVLLAGVTLFWNGIVGVFLFKVVQAWRGLGEQPASVLETVFLVPFVLIGSVMLLLLLVTVLEPFRKTVYAFSAREISRQFGYFGISWTKVWPIMLAVTMELDRETDFEDVPEMRDGREHSLKFSQGDENESEKLTEIGGLTLTEACWITTEIENRQSSYSRCPSTDDGDGFTKERDPHKQ